jgi:hypothetical protein
LESQFLAAYPVVVTEADGYDEFYEYKESEAL